MTTPRLIMLRSWKWKNDSKLKPHSLERGFLLEKILVPNQFEFSSLLKLLRSQDRKIIDFMNLLRNKLEVNHI